MLQFKKVYSDLKLQGLLKQLKGVREFKGNVPVKVGQVVRPISVKRRKPEAHEYFVKLKTAFIIAFFKGVVFNALVPFLMLHITPCGTGNKNR